MENKTKELMFQDFLGTKHQYDHTKENVWEAVGASVEDVKLLHHKIDSIFHNPNKIKSLSAAVEEALAIDMPAPWKAIGLMKAGERLFNEKMAHIVESAPNEIPLAVFKMVLMHLLGYQLKEGQQP